MRPPGVGWTASDASLAGAAALLPALCAALQSCTDYSAPSNPSRVHGGINIVSPPNAESQLFPFAQARGAPADARRLSNQTTLHCPATEASGAGQGRRSSSRYGPSSEPIEYILVLRTSYIRGAAAGAPVPRQQPLQNRARQAVDKPPGRALSYRIMRVCERPFPSGPRNGRNLRRALRRKRGGTLRDCITSAASTLYKAAADDFRSRRFRFARPEIWSAHNTQDASNGLWLSCWICSLVINMSSQWCGAKCCIGIEAAWRSAQL